MGFDENKKLNCFDNSNKKQISASSVHATDDVTFGL